MSHAGVAGLSELKSLGVDSTYVSDKSRDSLLGLKKLERLNLYHTSSRSRSTKN